MSKPETLIGRLQTLPETRLWHFLGLNQEIPFNLWFPKLPREDQMNVKTLGRWLLGVVDSRGEVWAVGSTVRNVKQGKRPEGNDIDLLVLSRRPNMETIEVICRAVEENPPGDFDFKRERRLDRDLNHYYWTFQVQPRKGRLLHLLPPKLSEIRPDEERNLRKWGVVNLPFARLTGEVIKILE